MFSFTKPSLFTYRYICDSKSILFLPLDRSSICDEPGERDDKLPKTAGLVRESALQTEGESLNRHVLSGVSANSIFLAIHN